MNDLTEREHQVMTHIVKGQTCKEIAKELQIAPKTVEVYTCRLRKKLKARNITHAAVLWDRARRAGA